MSDSTGRRSFAAFAAAIIGLLVFGTYAWVIGLYASAQSTQSWQIAQGIWLAWMGRWFLRELIAVFDRVTGFHKDTAERLSGQEAP